MLRRLARAAGVADRYEASGQVHEPPDATLRAVLTALGYSCGDDAEAAATLTALRRRRWREPVDPVAVQWRDDPGPTRVTLSAPDGTTPAVRIAYEDGGGRVLCGLTWSGVRVVDGVPRRRATIALPDDLPLGYHRLVVDDGRDPPATCTVIAAPARCPEIGAVRRWGWMVQTYALRSERDWGQGELTELAALAEWAAGHGADFVLTNPLHATAPVVPQQPSPYSPTSRRFANPAYLHVPAMPEWDHLPAQRRTALADLPATLATDAPRIDRDAVWETKRAAFEEMYDHMPAERRAALDRYRREQGTSLQRFATFCALAEEHGVPWTQWPRQLRHPDDPAVLRFADEHDDRVALHAWLQLSCAEQLRAVQDRAAAAGMAIGIIHDLAVGVDAGGADAWTLPDVIARDVEVGAPPDAFNQQGQNWAQPPLLPGALRRTGYATLRELLAASLTVGGGLRIDHILGLSRLFWIPRDAPPTEGTYVRYPADEQFAVLTLEAHRAGAVVVGEDLGTVDDRIRRLMRRRGVAGSAVLWFADDADGRRLPANRYPRQALASVTTHDLPTATGWWDGSALRTRIELGLLERPVDEERAELRADQRSLRRLLLDHGLDPGTLNAADDGSRADDAAASEPAAADPRAAVTATHRFLASSTSVLVAAAVWDAVGDPRQPNVPGTVDEYPNWRLPLAAPAPPGGSDQEEEPAADATPGIGPDRRLRPIPLEQALASTAVLEMVEAMGR